MMVTERVFTKTILMNKLNSELNLIADDLFHCIIYDSDISKVTVQLLREPTMQEDTDITTTINNHVPTPTIHDSIVTQLNMDVQPFIKEMMDNEAATNIELGITQAGKTVDVLGLIVEKHLMPGKTKAVSLKDCFDTGSLYAALEVLGYIRANPSTYTGLSPFITDARLLDMINQIETFLGLPLTES